MEGEMKVQSVETSLLVPCVQELAKESLTTIPPRYIRLDQQQITISTAVSSPEIPIIDMQKLLHGESMESELKKFDSACRQWGFFQCNHESIRLYGRSCVIIKKTWFCFQILQLVNHGVEPSLLEKFKTEVKDFFNLPIAEKNKLSQRPGDVEGFGQAFVISEDQKLDWCDIFFAHTQPVSIRKPHLIPKIPLPFRDTLDVYSLEIKNLAFSIMTKIGKALNIKDEEIKYLFEDGKQSVRMNYYPPCPCPEKAIGLTPHSDSVGLTILLQVSDVEGLQIKKDGKWISVYPLPNAFIVNIGDILEIVTNGAYQSIEHRARVNSERERISIAMFNNTRYDGEVGPAWSLISEQTPALFKRLTLQEYFNGLFARELSGKSYLDVLRTHNN